MREQGIPPSMQPNSSKLTLQEACSCRQDVLKRQSRCTEDKRENDVRRRTKASRDCMYPDDRCVWEGRDSMERRGRLVAGVTDVGTVSIQSLMFVVSNFWFSVFYKWGFNRM